MQRDDKGGLTATDAWAEIDLNAISHNLGQFKKILRPGCRLMAAVKADAYGHGILPAAERLLKDGADALGVARLKEALALRRAGIRAPILIFGYTPPEAADRLIQDDLTQTVYAYDAASKLSEKARALGGKIRAHLKVDTGMGRLGLLAGDLQGKIFTDALDEVKAMKRLHGIDLAGAYTHFATAEDRDKIYAQRQFDIFCLFLDRLKREGVNIPLAHAANSAATIEMPETHLDMVRVGISLYGYYPSEFVHRDRVTLRPAMTLKTRIIHLKKVDSGFRVSYGGTAVTTRPTRIATVSIGYADGYSRLLSSKGRMLVRGRRAPVIGRVCMDQTMLDVEDIPNVAVGDEVVVFGTQGRGQIPVEEVSKAIGTISYEVVSGISERVERLYSG